MQTIDWELRYRSPLAPSKGVDDVLVQIDALEGEHQDQTYRRAKVVADYWLANHRAHPNTTFIYLRPAVVMSERQMAREQAEAVEHQRAFNAPDDPSRVSDAERPVTAIAVPGQVIRDQQQADAMSDPLPMSGPQGAGVSSGKARSRIGQ